MVSIQSESGLRVKIIRDWHDEKDKIGILSLFSVFILFVLLFSENRPGYLYFLQSLFLIMLLAYILPRGELVIEHDKNRWYKRNLFLTIPYSKVEGTIIDIDLIVCRNYIEHPDRKEKILFKSEKFTISLEFWHYDEKLEKNNHTEKNAHDYADDGSEVDDADERSSRDDEEYALFEKIPVLTFGTNLRSSYLKYKETLISTGKALSKYFEIMGLDIPFQTLDKHEWNKR